MTEEMKAVLRAVLKEKGPMSVSEIVKTLYPSVKTVSRTPERSRVSRALSTMRKWNEVELIDNKIWRLIE